MSERSKYQPTKQELLDAGLNVFALQLVAESLLKGMTDHTAPEPDDDIEFFFSVTRSDCSRFEGINFILQPVLKSDPDAAA